MFFDVDLARLRARRTVKWTLYGPDVLAAWVAEMDFDVAPAVRDAITAAVAREDFGYVEGDLSELTTACSEFFAAQYHWNVAPTRIFPVADVLEGIRAAFEIFLEPGSAIVVPTPAYPPFFEIVELAGHHVVPVPLADDRLDLDAIETAFAARARGFLLCNPHNPTGRVFTADELRAFAALADRYGVRTVADEVHAPLVYPGHEHVPYATIANAITVTSASKAFNVAGLKCAQVIASNHDDAARWRSLRVHEVPGPTPLGIAATVAAYRDDAAWLGALVAYLDVNRSRLRDLVTDRLPGVTMRLPEATFLAWLDCRALGFDAPARVFLDRGRVAVSDGPAFGAGNEQFVRVNFATSRALLERIVDAMASAVS